MPTFKGLLRIGADWTLSTVWRVSTTGLPADLTGYECDCQFRSGAPDGELLAEISSTGDSPGIVITAEEGRTTFTLGRETSAEWTGIVYFQPIWTDAQGLRHAPFYGILTTKPAVTVLA
jgi:hypothetical protein